ncbi:hypothetical protein [Polyangium fumosum]|uniref:Uncharacterized protein n=1 Tax=Polyangium fumosum TaxID=889272 RepID=A0A4U1JI97_9BACT|nr:hypothetical protein [Polyangium fumosum]TKD12370.1 hypothetical protein E8A74_04525 [Polyangium fumosum]
MSQKKSKRAVAVPKSNSPEDLLDWAVHELSAQWNGGTDHIAIVMAGASAPLPSVYWMSRSEAADHTLEYANKLAASDPSAKNKLQLMAVEMLKPTSAGILQVSVATPKGAFLGNLDPDGLDQLNRQGSSSNAIHARKQLIQSQARPMHDCLKQWEAGGNDPQDAVIVIADPTDPRAATTAYVLNSVISEMTAQEDFFGGEPVVVGCPIPKAMVIFEKMRPKIVEWLNLSPAPGSTRVICMGHGGETCTHGKLSATPRKLTR